MPDRVPHRPGRAPDPQHATWDQITKAAASIIKGDPDRLDMIKESVKSKLQDLLPGRGTGQ